MKKDEKIALGLIIGILIIGSISITALAKPEIFDSFRQASSTYGCQGQSGTITSIDQTTFKSNSAIFDGKDAWLVEFNSLPSGQCLYGTFDEEEIQDGEEKATHGFTLDLDNKQQYCVYSSGSKKDGDVMRIDYKDLDEGCGIIDDCMEECESAYPTLSIIAAVPYDTSIWNPKTACYYVTQRKEIYSLAPQKHYEWSVDAVLHSKKTGDDFTVTLNSDTSSQWIGTDWEEMKDGWNTGALIKWAGNLVGNTPCPDASDILVYDRQKTTSEYQYERYFDYVWGGGVVSFQDCLEDAKSSTNNGEITAEVRKCKNDFNYYASRAEAHQPFCFGSGLCEDVINGEVKVESHFLIPNFQVLIDADELGVYQGVGEPQVVSFTVTQRFKDDSSGQGSAVVRNKGEAVGSFDVWMNCDPDEFYSATSSKRISLQPGNTKSLNFEIKGNVPDGQEITYTCTVTIRETTSLASDSESASGVGYDDPGQQDPNCYDDPLIAAGDTICDTGTSARAWKECLGSGDWNPGNCDMDKHCEMIQGQASCESGTPTCGNDVCEINLGENKDNCSEDCGGSLLEEYWWAIAIAVLLGGLYYYYYAGGQKGFTHPRDLRRKK